MELDEYRRMAEVETSHWWYGSTRRLLAQILSPHLPPGGRRLDAGCGTGATGAWLSGGADLIGADFEPLALELFREAHDASGLTASDVSHLPFADDAFDALLCVTVLCHQSVLDPVATVAELVRTVRPGGVVCLMEPGVQRLYRAHDRVTHTARRFSRAELAGLLTTNGCELLRSTGAYAFLIPPAGVKTVIERGRTSSDLDVQPSGLGGILPRLASAERRWLASHDLPAGLSVLAVGRVAG